MVPSSAFQPSLVSTGSSNSPCFFPKEAGCNLPLMGSLAPPHLGLPWTQGSAQGDPSAVIHSSRILHKSPMHSTDFLPWGPLLHGWVEMIEAWQAEVTQGSSLTQWERKLTSGSMRQKRTGLALHQLYRHLWDPQPPAPQYALDRLPSGRKKNNQIIGTQWHHWPHDVLNNTHSVTVFI